MAYGFAVVHFKICKITLWYTTTTYYGTRKHAQRTLSANPFMFIISTLFFDVYKYFIRRLGFKFQHLHVSVSQICQKFKRYYITCYLDWWWIIFYFQPNLVKVLQFFCFLHLRHYNYITHVVIICCVFITMNYYIQTYNYDII